MKLDASLWVDSLAEVPAAARAADELGFGAIWTSDTAHNPLFPLVLAAEHTQRIQLGTAIVVAFARSPMDVAYQAWDLAKFSQGRLLLGLGTQVSAHIERRFGMTWRTPAVDHMREYVQALRAIWQSWQTGEKLNVRGEFYKLTLMTPFFDPGKIDHPHIPIYTAGVNEKMCKLAGEVSDGFHAHPFHTRKYLQEVVRPAIQAGAQEAGRSLGDVDVSSAIFVATGMNQEQFNGALAYVRQQVAFYASTPTYAPVMDLHGWSETREELSRLAARKEWAAMPGLITDEMVHAFAIVCEPQDLADKIHEKYDGVLDRVTLYVPFDPRENYAMWAGICGAMEQRG
jgi:probable F420-dependent oxidoreductase